MEKEGGAFLSTQNEAFMGGVSCAKKDELRTQRKETQGPRIKDASEFLRE